MSTDRTSQALHPSYRADAPLSTDTLADIAAGLGAAPHNTVSPADDIVRTRLLHTESYDAWLMVWAEGTVADGHDHGGSVSVVHVVSGALAETARRLDDSAGLTRIVPAGSTTALAATGTHTLANRSRGVTVSVHVYSPPIGLEP